LQGARRSLETKVKLYAKEVVKQHHLGQAEIRMFVDSDILETECLLWPHVEQKNRSVAFYIVTTHRGSTVEADDVRIDWMGSSASPQVHVIVHLIAFNHDVLSSGLERRLHSRMILISTHVRRDADARI
jgi:hypothetical protein